MYNTVANKENGQLIEQRGGQVAYREEHIV